MNKYIIYIKAIIYYITVLLTLMFISGLDSMNIPVAMFFFIFLIVGWMQVINILKLPSYNKKNPEIPLSWEEDFKKINFHNIIIFKWPFKK